MSIVPYLNTCRLNSSPDFPRQGDDSLADEGDSLVLPSQGPLSPGMTIDTRCTRQAAWREASWPQEYNSARCPPAQPSGALDPDQLPGPSCLSMYSMDDPRSKLGALPLDKRWTVLSETHDPTSRIIARPDAFVYPGAHASNEEEVLTNGRQDLLSCDTSSFVDLRWRGAGIAPGPALRLPPQRADSTSRKSWVSHCA